MLISLFCRTYAYKRNAREIKDSAGALPVVQGESGTKKPVSITRAWYLDLTADFDITDHLNIFTDVINLT